MKEKVINWVVGIQKMKVKYVWNLGFWGCEIVEFGGFSAVVRIYCKSCYHPPKI